MINRCNLITIFLFLLSLTYHNRLKAQFYAGIIAEGGVSLFKETADNAVEFNEGSKYERGAAYNFGILLEKLHTEKAGFGFGLVFMANSGKKKFTEYNTVYTYEIEMDLKSSGFGIPIYLILKFDRFQVNPGLQFTVSNLSKNTSIKEYSNGRLNEYNRHGIKLNTDYAFRLGLSYYILKEALKVQSTYYHGMNNLMASEGYGIELYKLQQLSLGLTYIFPK